MTTAQYKKQYTTILQYVYIYMYMYKHKHTYNAHDKNSSVQK